MLKTVAPPNTHRNDNRSVCGCDVPLGKVVRFPVPHTGYRLLETKYPLVNALLLGTGFLSNLFMFVVRGSLLNLLVAVLIAVVTISDVKRNSKNRTHNHERIAAHLIVKRNVPTKTREWAAAHPCYVMRVGLASSPHTPTDILDTLIFDPNPHVVHAAAQNSHLSERARTIVHLNPVEPDPLNIQFKHVPKRAHVDCSGCGQFKRTKSGGTWYNVLCADCGKRNVAPQPVASCDNHKKHKPDCSNCVFELLMRQP